MNLYRVYNGFCGFTDVSSLVIAESEPRAIEIARPVFSKADKRPEYSKNLTAELVFADCSNEQVSEPNDC